jgi:hypothetical protein
MAKTPLSLTDNEKLKGRPTGFNIHVQDLSISKGAGFVVVYTGNILTMPGLPKVPAAVNMGVDEQGNSYIKVKGVRWFTNLDYNKRHDALTLTKLYDVEYYPMYDNYAAINVNKYSEIPKDYTGIMGVPITFMDFYCPDQFEIVGISASWCETEEMRKLKLSDKYRHNPILKGKEMYRRVFIKRIKGNVE